MIDTAGIVFDGLRRVPLLFARLGQIRVRRLTHTLTQTISGPKWRKCSDFAVKYDENARISCEIRASVELLARLELATC